jgi:hypothetical protein
MPTTIVYLRPGILDPSTMRRVQATLCRHHARNVYERDERGEVIITHREPSPGEDCEDCYLNARAEEARQCTP